MTSRLPIQKLRLSREDVFHVVELEFDRWRHDERGAYKLTMTYLSGQLNLTPGTRIAQFTVSYSLPSRHVAGHVDLGQGMTEIEVPALRGIGIGSFMMSILVELVKENLPLMEVEPIYLASEDAATDEARDRRNRFWTSLGYTLNFKDAGRRSGYSEPMNSSDLIQPPQQLKRGWNLEEIND